MTINKEREGLHGWPNRLFGHWSGSTTPTKALTEKLSLHDKVVHNSYIITHIGETCAGVVHNFVVY
jgi:hypothetical protein